MRENYEPCGDESAETLGELLADHQFDPDAGIEAQDARGYAWGILSIVRWELRLVDIEVWKRRRADIAAREDSYILTGQGCPDEEEWARSDDEGVALLAFILDKLTEDQP